MNHWETDFLNLENELVFTRKKLNDLIYEYQNRNQNIPDDAIYQDKLRYLEVELQYINNQLQLLKSAQKEGIQARQATAPITPTPAPIQNFQNPEMAQNVHTFDERQVAQNAKNTNKVSTRKVNPYAATTQTDMQRRTVPAQAARKPQDYEKLFGKNLMGIFASVLIFISLVIFATLILPHLTDTMKMLAMYIASIAVLTVGLVLCRKNKDNLFYIAIVGCGVGSLYLSLLLSNLYFKVIGDLTLYGFILLWAVFVRFLTKIKNLVFNIIGQAGIFIASVLGTVLCVHDEDVQKFFVLSIFYFISAVVFSNMGKTYLHALFGQNKSEDNEENIGAVTAPYTNAPTYGEKNSTLADKTLFYENNLCSHICKTLNVIVYTIGFTLLNESVYSYGDRYSASCLLIAFNVLLFMGYLLFEFFFSYMEKCRHGLAFQILSMINVVLLVCLFEESNLFVDGISPYINVSDWTFVFLYLVSIAALIYVEMKNAEYKLFSQIWCFFLIFTACINNRWMMMHLYPYITVVPFMLCGKWKKENVYLGAGIAYLAGSPLFIWSPYSTHEIEGLIMLIVLYGVFLYISRRTDQTWFKITGYIILSFTTMRLVYDISWNFWKILTESRLTNHRSLESSELRAILRETSDTNSMLTTFYVLAVIHLILSKLEYFGKEKVTKGVMYGINALLMIAGCSFMYATDTLALKLPVILIAILLFFANTKEVLMIHKNAGYYVALKYTVLMLCILGSFDVVDYAVSICLLVFAIISIVTGFYKDTTAFRLYGLVLSMISIVKLIMIDIKYDSTIENAVSFFVSGVLCFVISFIYNRIDGRLRGK